VVPLDLGLTVATIDRALSGQTVRLGALPSGGAAQRRLAWTQTAGPPVSLTDAASMHPQFVAPSVAMVTELEFRVVATDRSGGRVERTVSLEVSPAPLEVFAGGTQSVAPNQTVALNGRLRGSGDVVGLTWTQTGGTPVSLDDPDRLDPTFVAPGVDTFDTLTFELRATAPGGGEVTSTTHVEVQPPWFDLQAGPDLLAVEGETITLLATARGAFETPTWSWALARGDADIDLPTDASTTVTLGPPLAGVWEFEVTAQDLAGHVAVGNVVVQAAADPGTTELVVQTINQVLLTPGVPVRLHATASGGDGNYTYAWQDFGGFLLLSGSVTPDPRVSALEAGPIGGVVLQVKVTDGQGAVATANVVYDLSGPAGALIAGRDRTVAAGQRVYLNATAVGGTVDGVSWTKELGPTFGIQGLETANPNFVAPDLDSVVIFRAETLDLTPDAVEIDVDAPSPKPDIFGPVEVVSGQRFTLAAALDDPAADATFTWSQVGGPPCVMPTDEATAATIEPIAAAVFDDQLVEFSVVVELPSGRKEVQTAEVMVRARPTVTFAEPLPDPEVGGTDRRMYVCEGSTRCDLDQMPFRCPPEAPYGLNEVRMPGDGTYEVHKSCASAQTCRARWWGTSRLDADCSELLAQGADLAAMATREVIRVCDICCSGEFCNEQIFPPSDTHLWCDDEGCRPRP